MLEAPEAVLVVAWGNPARQDDGFAWHVLEGLRTLKPRPGLPALRLRHGRVLTPELAEPLSRAAGVVFVAARRQGTPGKVSCAAIRPRSPGDPLAPSLEPRGLLLYAEAHCGRAPDAVLVSVAGERFGEGAELSPLVRRAIPWAIRAVIRQAKALAAASDLAAVDPSSA